MFNMWFESTRNNNSVPKLTAYKKEEKSYDYYKFVNFGCVLIILRGYRLKKIFF